MTDTNPPRHPQSLAYGIPGIALLHIELAAVELRPWQRVHDWLSILARNAVVTGPSSSLFHGATAVAHALTCAAAIRPGSYGRALSDLDDAIRSEARRRVTAAHRRIDDRAMPVLAEYDLIRGLTGFGRYLLSHDPQGDAIRDVLTYLVRLTEPALADPTWPGWYSTVGPSGQADERTPGGHANNGVAHGIAGPLSLLALAAMRGVVVDGHHEAIKRVCWWFDRWQADTVAGPMWPYWISSDDLKQGRCYIAPPQRPSWCYGTAGHARALQLAGIACDDSARRMLAEDALIRALSDLARTGVTTDVSLCHGFAGLALSAARVAAEALPGTAERLRTMLPGLLDAICSGADEPDSLADTLLLSADAGPGLLDGAAGTALAISACTIAPPHSGWNTCLLIV